jgi:hypothetical protein
MNAELIATLQHPTSELGESSWELDIVCPVIGEFIARNPSYADLIDETHPGEGAYPRVVLADNDADAPLTSFERDLA